MWNTWEDNLGDLGAPLPQTIGQVGSIAGTGISTAGAIVGSGGSLLGLSGAVLGPIGAVVGIVAGLISSIFGQHAAKVQQENKISGQWAAAGPQAISGVVSAWQQGQADTGTAQSALDSIYQQFLQSNQSIAKYNGKTGAFPDPTAPRPSSNCNWACGTSWDLYQEIQGLKGQMSSGGPGVSASSLLGNPALLIGGGLVLFLLLKK